MCIYNTFLTTSTKHPISNHQSDKTNHNNDQPDRSRSTLIINNRYVMPRLISQLQSEQGMQIAIRPILAVCACDVFIGTRAASTSSKGNTNPWDVLYACYRRLASTHVGVKVLASGSTAQKRVNNPAKFILLSKSFGVARRTGCYVKNNTAEMGFFLMMSILIS